MTGIAEAKAKRDQLRARTLAIQAELARGKLAWLTTGQGTDRVRRAELEAEYADARAELNTLDNWLHAQRELERHVQNASFLHILLQLLQDAGQGELVREARRRATDAAAGVALAFAASAAQPAEVRA